MMKEMGQTVKTNPKRKRRTSRFQVRATPHQEALIRAIAEQRGVTVTDFILQSAYTEAEKAFADQQRFVLTNDQWTSFLELLDRPVQEKPRLRQLFMEKTVLEQG